MPLDERFLRETVEVWQPLSPTQLTKADAEEIATSMVGFFTALARCVKERQMREVQDGSSKTG